MPRIAKFYVAGVALFALVWGLLMYRNAPDVPRSLGQGHRTLAVFGVHAGIDEWLFLAGPFVVDGLSA